MQYQTPKAYRQDLCEQCGTCLQRCPVMKMSVAESRREISRLREGGDARALAECTSCFACDFFCPNGCNPAELILERWRRINAARGLPARAR